MISSPRPMTEGELAAIVDQQIADSILYEDSDLKKSRAKALRYFRGEETLDGDVPPQKNRSRVVSRDLSDTHGWIMPSLLRVFLGSDRVVIYEPRRKEAEKGAQQSTDYVNYVFKGECSGYKVLHSALWDGLALANGIIKHWWDDTPEYTMETLTGKTELEYIKLAQDPEVEIIEHTERTDPAGGAGGVPPSVAEGGSGVGLPPSAGAGGTFDGGNLAPDGDGQADHAMFLFGDTGNAGGGVGAPVAGLPAISPTLPAPKLHDLKIKRRVSAGCLKVVAVPQEEFRLDTKATALDEEHVRFAAHVSERTRSSLVAEGYPRDVVDGLVAGASEEDSGENRERGRSTVSDNSADRSTDLIMVWECFLQVDFNGDGVAEWRRVVTADGVGDRELLLNEEWGDGLPFTDLVPDPMPHQWRGRSLFDELCDLQQIKTVLWRGIYDNLYWANNPQRMVLDKGVIPTSMDDLYEPTYGTPVVVRSMDAIKDMPIPFVADKLMAGLDLTDKVREFRTGVSASTMSLDPQALQNQTATAVNAAATASYSKVETYARNIAEVGMTRLFKCILKLIVKHQDRPRTIRLRGEWVEVDPRSWDADMDVVINVGLGSGTRDRDIAMLQAISAKQELVVQGLGPMIAAQLGIGPDVIFATYRKMVEAAGIKSPESYFPAITRDDVQQIIQQLQQQGAAKPDPKMAETQAKIEAMQKETQAKIDADKERMFNEYQARKAQAGLDWQHRQNEAEIDNQHREKERQDKSAAKMQEIRLDHEFAVDEARRKFELMKLEIDANRDLKMFELAQEAQLKREQMAMQPTTPSQSNIQQASPS